MTRTKTNRLLRPRRKRSKDRPAFSDSRYHAKQESRERVAKAIAMHVGSRADLTIFLLPSNEVLCAKTIDAHVPHATFYGAEYNRYKVECTDAIRDGKHVIMQHNTVESYIRDNALRFDAAFLDYISFYTAERSTEIQELAAKMLKPNAVLAITVQQSRAADVAQQIQQDLMRVAISVVLVDSLEYTTDRPMINVIFQLTLKD